MILTGKSDLVLTISAPLAVEKKVLRGKRTYYLNYITDGSQLLTMNCKQERRNVFVWKECVRYRISSKGMYITTINMSEYSR